MSLERIPRDHREQLLEAGAALVRGLEGVGWRRIVLHFEVPALTDKLVMKSLDARLDNPALASKLQPVVFAGFVETMQKLFNGSGPEPWRGGSYEVWRLGDRIMAKAVLK